MRKYGFVCLFICLLTVLCSCREKNLPVTQDPAVIPKTAEKETDGENLEIRDMEIDDSKTEDDEIEDREDDESIPALCGKRVVVDAGHGSFKSNKQERIAPNTDETKAAFDIGTTGKNQTEEELNLSVALLLEKKLTDKNAEVFMTRSAHETDMTNIDRAEFANRRHADISVKLHADGSSDSSASGISVLIPGAQYISDTELLEKSKRAGEYVLHECVKSTGAADRGIVQRNDLTGLNWSEVPIILVEMGFMTNRAEDALMETAEYQQRIVDGIVNGLELYFEEG